MEDLITYPDPMASYIPDSLKYLGPRLDSVLLRDQKYRQGINTMNPDEARKALKEMGKKGNEIKSLQDQNLAVVSDIIEKYGWLSSKEVGMRGSLAIFSTIQHADLSVQEKYLPIIEDALKRKKASPTQYALLYDRVEARHGRPQKFGSQVRFLKDGSTVLEPLLNADSVDVWRVAIGVDSLKYYLKTFKIDWDKDAYKKEHAMVN